MPLSQRLGRRHSSSPTGSVRPSISDCDWRLGHPSKILSPGKGSALDERWVGEQIDNWVSDFLIDDAGDRVDREVAPHAQGILATFLRHACSIRKVTPDAIEESDVRAGLLEGLVGLSIPEQVQQQVPRLIGDFLADLQRRGRLAGGESHQLVIEVLREEYLRTSRGEVEPLQRVASKIGRNDPCPCGSGRKYKKCCLDLLGDGSK